jgi:HD-GYP domain-containing protein (c-di-GMP phosphodiesterase class II)
MKIRTEKEINDFLRELVSTLVSVIEEKDVFMKGHSERVASNCAGFCGRKGLLKKDEIQNIYFAGLLHDIGMVYIPLEILQKPEKLTEDEMTMIRMHPKISAKILSNLTFLRDIVPSIRCHHEAFDGSGYPDGLKGNEIPLGARILSLADTYDALTSARPHRPSLSMEAALGEIFEKSGTQFDNNLVNIFVEFIESTGGGSQIIQIKEDKAEAEKRELQGILTEIVTKFNQGKIDPPVLPQIVQQVKDVIKNKNSSPDDLTEVIEKDAAIALRLVSVANSPLYRGVKHISTVKNAIPRLGLKQTENIVSAIAHKSLYESKNAQFRIMMEKLWLHSLATAYGARAIAEKLGLEDAEQFFMMGLVHDVGKILLLRSLSETLKTKTVNTSEAIACIHQLHCGFGGAVLQRWSFSEDFTNVAKHHEGPEFSKGTNKGILITNLANNLTRNIGYSLSDANVELSELESSRHLGIDAEALNTISETVKELMKNSAQLF